MSTIKHNRVKELLDRIARVASADEWGKEINPTQWTALSYLAHANRFSRSPSQVAEFMAATRGTVSQTLKALERKDLITQLRSDHDKRSISYSVTKQGVALLQRQSVIDEALSLVDHDDASSLLVGLDSLVRTALHQRGLRTFGVCETCIHHQKRPQGSYCKLLGESLNSSESTKICHEHV